MTEKITDEFENDLAQFGEACANQDYSQVAEYELKIKTYVTQLKASIEKNLYGIHMTDEVFKEAIHLARLDAANKTEEENQ